MLLCPARRTGSALGPQPGASVAGPSGAALIQHGRIRQRTTGAPLVHRTNGSGGCSWFPCVPARIARQDVGWSTSGPQTPRASDFQKALPVHASPSQAAWAGHTPCSPLAASGFIARFP